MTREGIVGTVMTNNNVTLNLPAGYQQQQLLGSQLQQCKRVLCSFVLYLRFIHIRFVPPPVQIQKLQMRQNAAAMVQGTRLAGPVIHGAPSRINVGAPPPPPPYPGPPPPYPGSTTPQVPLSLIHSSVLRTSMFFINMWLWFGYSFLT